MSMTPALDHNLDRAATWVAWHLPHRVVTAVYFRVLGASASTGPWANQEIPRVTFQEAYERWREASQRASRW